ncbi:RNA 2'-phosphotransferase [Asaia bogorensis]|uniref:RNA 2'-phosphotransferase n=1 Tax=Asaia bogorensis TaxID=91915 RepID=UPI0021C1EFFE|nr:RNA 2'-phosphotransferase [Asaia bogorensis]
MRHEPERIDITLDNAGWANIDELLRSASEVGYSLDRPMLLKIIEKSDKQRFTLSSDGHCIRAAQGHSLAIDLGIPTSIPPRKIVAWHSKEEYQIYFERGIKARPAT